MCSPFFSSSALEPKMTKRYFSMQPSRHDPILFSMKNASRYIAMGVVDKTLSRPFLYRLVFDKTLAIFLLFNIRRNCQRNESGGNSSIKWMPFWAADPKGTKSCRTQGESVRPSIRLSVPPRWDLRGQLSPLTCWLRPL